MSRLLPPIIVLLHTPRLIIAVVYCNYKSTPKNSVCLALPRCPFGLGRSVYTKFMLHHMWLPKLPPTSQSELEEDSSSQMEGIDLAGARRRPPLTSNQLEVACCTTPMLTSSLPPQPIRNLSLAKSGWA